MMSTSLHAGTEREGRCIATLTGLAIGDALGMPTQSLAREEVVMKFEPILSTFYPSRPDHPFAPGIGAATVTDDTEQTLLLANELLSPGGFDATRYARQLLEWEDDVRRRGLLDLLGPSTKAALDNLARGMDPRETGTSGTTNGAAMRIAPVGIVSPSDDLEALVRRVIEVSSLTHNTTTALSGAAAVATVISAGIDDVAFDGALDLALRAVRMVESMYDRGNEEPMSAALSRALDVGRRHEGLSLIDEIIRSVGTSLASVESVPAAFAVLASSSKDAWFACRLAASLGGDTDTIAAMTGAMAGALLGPTTIPRWAIDEMQAANDLPLKEVARRLLRARD